MKIRSGFVSNSSSSSFIVDFDGEPTIEKIKNILSSYGEFEDLDYSAKCFMDNLTLLTEEDIKARIKEYKKWKMGTGKLEHKLKLLKEHHKGLYEIYISDHRDEDPWAIMNVKRNADGDIEDYDVLECELQWSHTYPIIDWESCH